MGWMVQGLNPSGGEIFCTCPDWRWGALSLPYDGYHFFPGDKWPGHVVDHPPPYSAEIKERVELYRHTTSEASWPV